jgi:hypothetical protein
MARRVWRKLGTFPSVQRSSQTLTVVGNHAFIFGGELKPRELVDQDVYMLNLRSGNSILLLCLTQV